MSCTSPDGGSRGRRRPPDAARARGQHVVEQIAGALIAGGNVRRHRLHHDVVDRLRHFRVLQPRRGQQLAPHQPIQIGRRGRVVGQHAGEHLVHRDAERIDVRRKHRLAEELLRRHVRRAADDRRAVRGDLEKARRAEVGDLHQAVVGDQHVGRTQVAVQHALTMGVVDGVADLAGVVERRRQIERAIARQDRFERLARHELHHDEEHVLLFLRREDGDDVRVIQAWRAGAARAAARRSRRPACAGP